MRQFLFCLILFFSFSIIGYSQNWKILQQNSPAEITFSNDSIGFICGQKGRILRTMNHGNTWDSIATKTTKDLHTIIFVNPDSGFVAGDYGTILKTSNTGNKWDSINSPFKFDVFSIFFLTTKFGFAAGSDGNIIKTTDGGNSWNQLSTNILEDINKIMFFNVDTGIAVGNNGTIIKTVDGGFSWTLKNADTRSCFIDIYINSKGVAVSSGTGGRIVYSEDFGETWIHSHSLSTSDLRSLSFVNDSIGYAFGDLSTVLHTVDKGKTWAAISTGTPNYYYDSYFFNDSTGFVVCGDGSILNTNNYCDSWSKKQFCNFTSNADIFTSVFFTDENVGYVASVNGALKKTINGGATWKNLSINNIWNITFATPSEGFALREGDLYKTENAGKTWGLLFSKFSATKILFLDSLNGYALSINSVRKTNNGGNSWVEILKTANDNYNYYCMAFRTKDTGVVAMADTVYYTLNGGLTWRTEACSDFNSYNVGFRSLCYSGEQLYGAYYNNKIIQIPYYFDVSLDTYSGVMALAGSKSGEVFAVGYGGLLLKKRSVMYNNYWDKYDSITPSNLYDVYFVNSNTGYAVGDKGVILKASNCVNSISNNLMSKKSQVLIYPNPSMNELNIEIPEITNQNLKISIYSITGELIIQDIIFDKKIDISSLSNGMYILKIENGTKNFTAKFIKE